AADDGGRLVEVRVGEQQHELVATNAGELISRTQHCLRRRREVDQRRVTGLVTLDVVDLLQPVEIQERDRQRPAPPLEAGGAGGGGGRFGGHRGRRTRGGWGARSGSRSVPGSPLAPSWRAGGR